MAEIWAKPGFKLLFYFSAPLALEYRICILLMNDAIIFLKLSLPNVYCTLQGLILTVKLDCDVKQWLHRYKCISVRIGSNWCKFSSNWCNFSSNWSKLVQIRSNLFKLVQIGANQGKTVKIR